MNNTMHYPLATLGQAARFFIEDNRHCTCVARLWERRAEYNPIWQWSTFRRKIERGENQRDLRTDMKLHRQKLAAIQAHRLAAPSLQRSERFFIASERRVAAFIEALPANERIIIKWLMRGQRLARLAEILNVSRATLSKRRNRIATAALKAFPKTAKRMLRKPSTFTPSHYELLSTFVQGETTIRVYKA